MDPINTKEQLLANAGWDIRAKFLLCGSFLVIFMMARFSGLLVFPIGLFTAAALMGMFVNLPHHWLMRKLKDPERILSINMTIDVLILTFAAYTLGDLGKLLALLTYPLIVIFAGVVMNPKRTYFYANLSVISLATLTFLEHHGVVPAVSTLMLDLSGTTRFLILSVIFPLYNFIAYFVGYLAELLRKREAQLVYSAFHDELTDLPSRDLFRERLDQALARANGAKAKGRNEYLIAVLFLDLDGFKVINNIFGPRIGDKFLVEVARRLEACVKPGDTVAHMAGDEYTILLEDFKDENVPSRLVERIQEALSLPFNLAGREAFTSASVGIVLPSSTGYSSPEDILRDAHTAMYRAKALGKARHEIFDATMRPRVVARMELETDLRHAIEREEFQLAYQPIVALPHERLVGFEALLRWNSPQRGPVSPEKFIPITEELGLIIPIGRWVLQAACRQLHDWHTQFPSSTPLGVSVNLSPRQFTDKDLYDHVIHVLANTHLDPRYLTFEITESILVENVDSAIAQIERMRDLGIRFHIDDFGTGYSSLSYLRRLNVDKLKIDRSFIFRIEHAKKDLELVRNIILLAHSLELGVIAEGVESVNQLKYLKQMGCDYGQGYLFSKPVDPDAAAALIATAVRVP